MRIGQRLIAATVLAALSCALAACGTNGSFDPTDVLDMIDTKKKLPGERKPVFPNGVPGVEQGVPKELYKGAQQQQQDQPPVVEAAPAPEPKSKKGATAHVRPSVAPSADQPPPPPEAEQDSGPASDDNVAAAPPAPPMKKPKRRSITAPDADTQPPQQTQSKSSAQPAPQQQSANPFPAPLPSGGFQR